jgi:ABC-2 type transport system permease protein
VLTKPRSPDGLTLVNKPKHLLRGSASDLGDVWRHRELLRAFVSRELRARYKGTRLGWLWALVRPLVMLLVYGLAVGVFLGAGRVIPQFMIFIYSGLLAWTFFATIIVGSITAVISNGALLTRARFPSLLLPLSVVLAALVDFALQASVLAVGYLIFWDLPDPRALLWLPPAILVLVFTGLALGLTLSALNVYIRDVGFLTDVALQVGFWLAPILYAYGQVVQGAQQFGFASELVTRVYMLNPMANVVIAFQRALWPAASSEQAAAFAFPGQLGTRLACFGVTGLIALWISFRIHVKLSGNFGQEL